MASAFQAVAHRIRRDILGRLRAGEVKAGDLAREFNVSWPAISQHLRVLKRAQLIRERKEGRERFYTLDRDRIRDLFGAWVAAFDAM